MNYEVYRELLSMLDMEEVFKRNPIHIEICKRIGAELSKETYWKHPDYEEPQTREEELRVLRSLLED